MSKTYACENVDPLMFIFCERNETNFQLKCLFKIVIFYIHAKWEEDDTNLSSGYEML